MSHTCCSQRTQPHLPLSKPTFFGPCPSWRFKGPDEALQRDMQRTNTEIGLRSPNQILSLIPSFLFKLFLSSSKLSSLFIYGSLKVKVSASLGLGPNSFWLEIQSGTEWSWCFLWRLLLERFWVYQWNTTNFFQFAYIWKVVIIQVPVKREFLIAFEKWFSYIYQAFKKRKNFAWLLRNSSTITLTSTKNIKSNSSTIYGINQMLEGIVSSCSSSKNTNSLTFSFEFTIYLLSYTNVQILTLFFFSF